MDQRRKPRVDAMLPVRIWGVDSYSRPFMQLARVKNVSSAEVTARRQRIGSRVKRLRMGGSVRELVTPRAERTRRREWCGGRGARFQIAASVLPGLQRFPV